MTAFAEVIEPLGKRRVVGRTSVISETGCYVCAKDSLAVGDVVQFRVVRDGTTFHAWARVADAAPDRGMGLAFLGMEQSQSEILKKWLAEFQACDESDRRQA